jgi:hypothetical protein
LEESWKSGINAVDRIKDIEEKRESDDELADAKHYLNEVLFEVSKQSLNMRHLANSQCHNFVLISL